MIAYILRRVLYAIPILVGVNLFTFLLFFMVNTPDDMARMQLGQKRVTPEAIQKWKAERGYDKPLAFNDAEAGARKLVTGLVASNRRAYAKPLTSLSPQRPPDRHLPRSPDPGGRWRDDVVHFPGFVFQLHWLAAIA